MSERVFSGVTVERLYAGKPVPFGPKNSPSSIVKAKHNCLTITKTGALEDEQGNKKLHGGPFMAVHQYSQAAYNLLQSAFPDTPVKIEIGTIGENISTPEMDEENVFIGDTFKFGSAILQVVSPRAPCAKINHRYGQRKIDLFVAQNGITGWYYSVLQEGKIQVGDKVRLLERKLDPISVRQIWELRQFKASSDSENSTYLEKAKRALELDSLAPEWKSHVERLIKRL